MADYSPSHAAAPDDAGDKGAPDAQVTRYWREIERYDRRAKGWRETGERITKKYRDEDRAQQASEKANTARRLALLWSNVETLKPAVYAKLPTAVVSRRFKDEDPVGRVGAELLERASNCLTDLYGYDETFRMVRDDRLLPGRGQAWVRYEAQFEDVPEIGDDGGPVMGDDGKPRTYQRLQAVGEGDYGTSAKAEKVCLDHVHWCDFGHNVARVWADVWLVWRKVYWTRGEVRKRFGREVAEALTYNVKPVEDGDSAEGSEHKACLYELWDKRRRRTCFLAKQYPRPIDDDKPPLSLHGFFPCPEPAYGTKTADSLIPRPDYCYYQDQAEEIDDLTAKIGELTDWLIVKGFIPGGPSSEGADAIERLLREKGKQILIPIESWSGWTERGGARQIDWLPLDIILLALKGAIEARQQLIQDVYQITGVSDILRGQTDPDETLGAQQLKAQTGSRRVRNTKDELARFARDTYRLVCEAIAENFHPTTLAAMTGYKYVPGNVVGMRLPQHQALPAPGMPQQPAMGGQEPAGPSSAMAGPLSQPGAAAAAPQMQPPGMPEPEPMVFDDQVVQRLRDDRVRSYSIDVETDSTIQPDEDAEKQRRVEFATMFGSMLKQASELMQMGPLAAPLVPMVGEAIKFTVRGFRAGRALEDSIDRALDQLLQMVRQLASQPPKPTPEEVKLQGEMAAQKRADERAKVEMAAKAQEDQRKAQLDQQKQQLDERMAVMDMQLKEREHAMKLEQMERQAQLDVMSFQMEMQKLQQQAALAAARPKGPPNGEATAEPGA